MSKPDVRNLFVYRNGKLYNRVKRNRLAKKGIEAGWLQKGYRIIRVNGKRYPRSHLVWLWHKGRLPKKEIDHKNRNRLDDRISNLREVDHITNCRNLSISSKNTSGITGVYWDADKGNWCAQMKVKGHTFHLGSFKSKENAAKARKQAEKQYGYAPNHGTENDAPSGRVLRKTD